MTLLKKLAANLPKSWQAELKRAYFGRQIKKDTFFTNEPEYELLHTMLKPGDWAIDIGANVGHYTKKFSDLVGPSGRVLAFEPVTTTFSLLASNVNCFRYCNVSLFNTAASDKLGQVGMLIPKFDTGLDNFYMAHLSKEQESDIRVLTLQIDSLVIKERVSLIKIDAEGHERSVLAGMEKLIRSSMPYLIIETGSEDLISQVNHWGYSSKRLQNSPNILFRPLDAHNTTQNPSF